MSNHNPHKLHRQSSQTTLSSSPSSSSPSININEAIQLFVDEPSSSLVWSLVSAIDPQGMGYSLSKSNFNAILSIKHLLISDTTPLNIRIPGFHLLATALLQHHPDSNIRVSLFVDIVSFPLPNMDIPELAARLNALYNLTKSGKEGGAYPSFSHIIRRWLRKSSQALSQDRLQYQSMHSKFTSIENATLIQRVHIRLISLIEGYIKSNISQIRSANLTKLVLGSLNTINPTNPNPIETPCILRLLQSVLSYAYVPNSTVERVVFALCAVIGSQAQSLPYPDSETTWDEAGWSVLRNLLRSQCANIAAKAIREISTSQPYPPIQAHLGALKAIRFCLQKAKEKAHDKQVRTESGAPKSTPSFTGEEDAVNVFTPVFVCPVYQAALKRNSPLLDQEIWKFAKDWLDELDQFEIDETAENMENSAGSLQQLSQDSSEEEIAMGRQLLVSLLEAGRDRVHKFRYPDQSIFKLYPPHPSPQSLKIHDFSVPPQLPLYATILSRIQYIAFKKRQMPQGLPSLLLDLSSHLDASSALALIDYQKAAGRCDPSDERWLHHLFDLVQRFYLPIPSSTSSIVSPHQPLPASSTVRQSVAHLLFETTFEILRDVQRFRRPLLERLTVPLLEQTMAFETDPEVESIAWDFLCTVAVIEAVEEDEEDRKKRDGEINDGNDDETKEEDAESDVTENNDIYPPVIGHVALLPVNFSRISTLLRSLATLPETEPVGGIRNLPDGRSQRSSMSSQSTVLTISPGEIRLPTDAPRTMMSLVSAPAVQSSSTTSPHRRTSVMHSKSRERSVGRERASFSSSARDISGRQTQPTSASASTTSSPKSANTALPTASPVRAGEEHHFIFPPTQYLSTNQIRSKAVGAVITLIHVFDKLAFSPPHSLTTNKLARAPASRRCILIIRELLNLLTPPIEENVDSPTNSPKIQPKLTEKRISPTARIHALQFLFHLRADRDYRIFADIDLDEAIQPSASILRRVRQDIGINEEERGRGRTSRRADIRGRSRDQLDKDLEKRLHDRSRSASRPPNAAGMTTSGASQLQSPRDMLWMVPEQLPFELTRSSRPAEGMVTHDPDTATDKQVPLPVSEYISALVNILEYETDWEIVSYVLCQLPLQLANKNFFSGPRAADSLRDLRRLLCNGLLRDKLCEHVNLPGGIKRTEVYAVAYQSLTVLVAYRRLFDKSSHDEMIEAFLQGLSRYHSTARPCVHALVLCCYELQNSMVRYMGSAIQKLSQIMSAASMGSHILELLVSVGHMPTLFSNFTEADYRRVFGMTLQYIQYHNAINADPGSRPGTIAESTLSEHVLSIAYYNIYIWFLSLKLKDRSHYVPIIIRGLLVANEHSGKIDEQSEVCFDMIMRYAYSNVNPRTIRSPLAELLLSPTPNSYAKKAPGTFKQWVMGNAVISVEALDRAGWVQIIIRRPSGSTTLLSKLENFSLVGSETDLVDITTVRTALMTGSLPTSVMRTNKDPTVLRAPSLNLDSDDYSSEREVGSEIDNDEDEGEEDSNEEEETATIHPDVEYPTQLQDLVLPEHIMLQLSTYPNTHPTARLMPNNTATERFIRSLESHQVVDSHKIGVIFVGRGQSNETDILLNTHGSPQYVRFLSKLGHLIRLKGHDGYVGGLDKEQDMDGKYAYAWWDDIDQVIFHVATLMPNHPHDLQARFKKAHIGNDFVRIVWNGSGLPYQFNTISTDFNYINIVISPHSKGVPVHRGAFNTKVPPIGVAIDEDNIDEFYRVELQIKEGMPSFGPIGDFKIVSTDALPDLIRQMALFADLLAQVYVQVDLEQEFVSSWRRRLQTIKRYRERDLPEMDIPPPAEGILGEEVSRDFSRFV
ncbi:hypothetical protein E3Q17_02975 [Wallemia mellicola]|uniref:Rap-GAP domain-containing protein n=1 Tax=Wallemia mellicola TaxID=1708541 RepID=A0A4T0NMP9_9BASI|nr:hypothetical protein E3Q17_02975 [Wallemia mellicola]TIC10220.1 hypothetical protein E3Q14_02962 [Wallemia mellicola]